MYKPYLTMTLLISRNNRIPLGEEESNCNLWDLKTKLHIIRK